MQTDESGAPWPYEAVDLREREQAKPSWECPEGICVCQPPATPTDIDSHDGHYVLHPDYSDYVPVGRVDHYNHIHAQLGPTRYPSARRR
jgi:hypothetical protein